MLIWSQLWLFDSITKSLHRVYYGICFLHILKYFSHSIYTRTEFSQTNSASSRWQKNSSITRWLREINNRPIISLLTDISWIISATPEGHYHQEPICLSIWSSFTGLLHTKCKLINPLTPTLIPASVNWDHQSIYALRGRCMMNLENSKLQTLLAY